MEYLKQKQESDHRKEKMPLRREELEASVEQQRQQNDMMKKVHGTEASTDTNAIVSACSKEVNYRYKFEEHCCVETFFL